jgi:hypothetical protein
MKALKSRLYLSIGDLERVIELLCTSRAVEAIDVWPPVYELRRHLRSTDSPGAADTRVCESREGAVAAFATIWDDTPLIACIHPQVHCDALSQEILLWGLALTRELGLIHGERAGLFVPIRVDDHRSGALLERHGFVPEGWQGTDALMEGRALGMALVQLRASTVRHFGTSILGPDSSAGQHDHHGGRDQYHFRHAQLHACDQQSRISLQLSPTRW